MSIMGYRSVHKGLSSTPPFIDLLIDYHPQPKHVFDFGGGNWSTRRKPSEVQGELHTDSYSSLFRLNLYFSNLHQTTFKKITKGLFFLRQTKKKFQLKKYITQIINCTLYINLLPLRPVRGCRVPAALGFKL